jgi:hypothetical protein
MAEASDSADDTVLERARVREVTGIFYARENLNAVAYELLVMDFDRADVDVVANLDDSPKKPSAAPAASEELADASRRPRWLRVVGKHITVLEVVIVSILGAIAAGAAVLLMSFAAGSSIGEIVVTAALVGMVAAGAGFLLALRILGRDEAHGLDNLMAERGLTLRVRVHSREQESLAQEILRTHQADAIRVKEISLEQRPENMPLSTGRPDPWLNSEPLGHP